MKIELSKCYSSGKTQAKSNIFIDESTRYEIETSFNHQDVWSSHIQKWVKRDGYSGWSSFGSMMDNLDSMFKCRVDHDFKRGTKKAIIDAHTAYIKEHALPHIKSIHGEAK